ncbi:MAG: sigma-70 family RNA polymerase sigma factor [Bacteroidales bacterium]|nr:sigma-70 family RNA polymerase sigma factor [Bacteroidales bacterium]
MWNNVTITELFIHFRHLVFGVCFKYLKDEEKAKDAVMSIFEKLLSNPPEEEIRNIKNWLYTISKNHCLLILRHEGTEKRYKANKARELEAEIMEFPSGEYPDNASFQTISEQRLHQAVDRLKKEQRICIISFYFEDYSYQEIVDHTGYSYDKVKSYIQNGKRNLKIMLEDVNDR